MDSPPKKTETEDKPKSSNPDAFKKPILIGKIGKLPRKVQQISDDNKTHKETVEEEKNKEPDPVEDIAPSPPLVKSPAQQVIENNIPLPYKEPEWSGLPETTTQSYKFEVLKNGSIIETVDLMKQPFWIFGRLNTCDICMQHPTISRYHAVLQYRSKATEKDPKGFYVYDLDSTHGTFLNKSKLRPKIYVRMQVGHMLKLGCSTRSYILTGPEEDSEEESEFSVTELKQKREERLRERADELLRLEKEREERKKREEERGVDWGLGEDADEEEDLSENPYAQTNNEELYIDDPKKALRGFYEREGLDLEYDCTEQGMGQFLCKVELPLDDEMGRSIFAEVLHKGKKKEAVVQCALEACRILDRHGLLRQATHESRKRKAKNWEENDYYDSDEDTFLDRTGTVEKKREMRMKSKVPQKAETYESLLEKEKALSISISELEKTLSAAQSSESSQSSKSEEDSLDSFMKELQQPRPDRQSVSRMKLELAKLKKEHANVIRLANVAKPASLPPIVPNYEAAGTSKGGTSQQLPVFGKRLKVEVRKPEKKAEETVSVNDEEEEEMEEEEEEKKVEERREERVEEEREEGEEEREVVQSDNGDTLEALARASNEDFFPFEKFKGIFKRELLPFTEKYHDRLKKILNNLKTLAVNEDRMNVDWKLLSAKKRKVIKLIADVRNYEPECPSDKLEHKISSELNRILQELNVMTEQKFMVLSEVKKMGNEIRSISEAISKDYLEIEEKEEETEESRAETDERKKKKNLKRIQQRQEKVEMEKRRGYQEDATRDDYNMWVPPTDQTGDGRTSLNDKYGY